MKRKPTTWQEILEQEFMIPLSMTTSEVAVMMQMTESSFLSLYNSDDPITPEIAQHLSQIFNTSTGLWLNLNRRYQQWLVESKKETL